MYREREFASFPGYQGIRILKDVDGGTFDAMAGVVSFFKRPDISFLFLCIYPKRGPLQQLDLSEDELLSLLAQYVDEGNRDELVDFTM